MSKSKQTPDLPPSVGDKVTVGNSDTVWEISAVSDDGKEVRLHIPRTNLERFRVPVADLTFVDRRQIAKPASPLEPKIDIDGIHERLVVAQHDSVQRLSADVAQLKQLLALDGAPASVGKGLDTLCAEVDERWDAAIRAVMERLEG